MLKLHRESIEALRDEVEGNVKIGLVSGNFNVVHPGHMRLLKFAADCCDILVVAINPDGPLGVIVPAELRHEAIKAISLVDYSFILEGSIEDALQTMRPDIVVKGKEHQAVYNAEMAVLSGYGGKLLFGSGESVFSSIDLIRGESDRRTSSFNLNVPHKYLQRHDIRPNDLIETLGNYSNLNVLVIGDLIVDEYITCDVLGLSQEDPTVVVTPLLEQKFMGGAGIVASHARKLGASVTYLTVCGDDAERTEAAERLKGYGVDAHIATDESRPTTLKRRYRAQGKTLLRVSRLKQHGVAVSVQNDLFEQFKSRAADLDLVIFADFNYGTLPQALVDRIAKYCRQNDIKMVADSQSSSQIGDVSRFENMLLVTPTEFEARIAIHNHDVGLVAVVEALAEKCNPKNVILTLGSEGSLIQCLHPTEGGWMTDRLAALCRTPKDPAGAGDAMLVVTSMALVLGASIWEAAYLGAVAAGCQVSTVGNTPLEIETLMHELGYLADKR